MVEQTHTPGKTINWSKDTTIYQGFGQTSVTVNRNEFYKVVTNSGLNLLSFQFQQGPVKNSVNGVFVEHLLVVCAHKLFHLDKNSEDKHTVDAMEHVLLALEALKERTHSKIKDGSLITFVSKD
jgi:hypothetical protein